LPAHCARNEAAAVKSGESLGAAMIAFFCKAYMAGAVTDVTQFLVFEIVL